MDTTRASLLSVRDALETDIPALLAIKGGDSEALHRDRLHEAQGSAICYLVLAANEQVIGCVLLVFRRPVSWSDSDDAEHLPQIVDLQIHADWRGRGYGSQFVRVMEQIAAQAGYSQLYLSVEPRDNPRAYALYQRLGYQPLQTTPYQKAWGFTDSAGNFHHGEDWVVDMVKRI